MHHRNGKQRFVGDDQLSMSLSALPVVDLYVGQDFADYTIHSGSDAARMAVPAELMAEVNVIRDRCLLLRNERQEDEFSITFDGDLYRVTAFLAVDRGTGGVTFFLSRGTASVLPLGKLGIPSPIRDVLLDPATTGLVIFAGPRGSGKTTSASSVISERLRKTGGTALALQDPIETMLDGLHGEGRCIQSPISRRHGGYQDALIKAMRTRVGTVMLGEIREAGTAGLAIESGLSGIFLLSTLHGDPKAAHNIRSSLNRLLTFASKDLGGSREAAEMLSASITLLIQQRLEPVSPGSATKRAVLSCLNFADATDGAALRSLVREQKLDQIQSIADAQAKRTLWDNK